MKALRTIKNVLVPEGRRPRKILTGPFKGIRMDLDLRTESQIYAGLFEKELHPSLRRISEGIRSAIDIGAAHGEYTLYALMKTSAERVMSLEPDLKMVARLRRNLQLNGLEQSAKWELHTKYLADADAPDCMDAGNLSDWVVAPCLIKMDIDEGEGTVLRAASARFLRTPGLRWLIETHSKALEEECISILASHGYSTTIIPKAWWRAILPEQRFRPHNQWLIATR